MIDMDDFFDNPKHGHEIPDLRALGSSALVEFEVRKLSQAKVVWTNDLWFAHHGISLTSDSDREQVHNSLLRRFGYCVYDGKNDSKYADIVKYVHADRYGSGGAGLHGGSGRVATIGKFQVKGIGTTPLATHVKNVSYSHGCMWIEEAIRESVLALISDIEFPYGAIQPIAIIDTGLFGIGDDQFNERRALLIRPAAVRPAHLERAVLYGSNAGPDQIKLDIQRTRDAHRAIFQDMEARIALSIQVKDHAEMVSRVVSQIAYGQSHRLHMGGYFSSNISINGELLDFGSFCSVPDWRSSKVSELSPPFGQEAGFVDALMRSYKFHSEKFGVPSGHANMIEMQSELEESLRAEICQIFGVDISNVNGKLLTDEILKYVSLQRKDIRDLSSGQNFPAPWLFDHIEDFKENDTSVESTTLRNVFSLIESFLSASESGEQLKSSFTRILRRIARLLEPRLILYRMNLQGVIYALHSENDNGSLNRESVNATIDACLTEGARSYVFIGSDVTLLAQIFTANGGAFLCKDAAGNYDVRVIGTMRDAFFYAFGEELKLDSRHAVSSFRKYTIVKEVLDIKDPGEETILKLGGTMALPKLTHWYCADSSLRSS